VSTSDEYRAPTPEDYRTHAADCLRMMQLATVEEVRAAFLLMAQSWNSLADRLEGMQSVGRGPEAGA
jgi:hypothetical protein